MDQPVGIGANTRPQNLAVGALALGLFLLGIDPSAKGTRP